ncbi:LysM peptidoglycan-binding domain-containing protein [Cryobacterium glaciale]|uniref:LysM peptidoglycan-binding domain-containing protein n=1 Tax=Cryobacterium glaciale TaxID=1259145 RepID=A0A4R8UTC5_9MICO|nr:LysM peptidoglycan-binding domain-containing protein [Cryobacterium glaciale]TFB69682.1 LysM peptidoglycan-binding domain-containing protein [Cryobacterium glaciale]
MSTKVNTKTTDAAASAGRSETVPGDVAAVVVGAAGIGTDATRQRAKKPGDLRSRPALLTVPIVLVSTLAISLNLAAPAQAQALAKKPLKSKLAETTPVLSVAAVAAVQVAPAQYAVVDGDTVSGIAARFGLSTAAVLALNGLDSRALIFAGQVLTLTQAAPPAAAPAGPAASAGSYVVQSGDTISGIAAAHGLKTTDVLGANALDGSSVIYPGQVVLLAAAPALEAAVYVAPVAAVAATHTIASGETITAVANAAGVSVQAVLDANGLGWSSIIYPGQVLTLPVTAPPASVVAASAPITAATAGVVTPMSEEMRLNAQIIVSVGRGAGVNDDGLIVALAAAAQESGLRNVDYGDRDSLGLFQQRPSAGWGTPEQVMDPVRASLAFFGGASNPNPDVTRGLLDIPGWESMTVTQAAQAVQISAYPDYYAKWEASARAWLSQIG